MVLCLHKSILCDSFSHTHELTKLCYTFLQEKLGAINILGFDYVIKEIYLHLLLSCLSLYWISLTRIRQILYQSRWISIWEDTEMWMSCEYLKCWHTSINIRNHQKQWQKYPTQAQQANVTFNTMVSICLVETKLRFSNLKPTVVNCWVWSQSRFTSEVHVFIQFWYFFNVC